MNGPHEDPPTIEECRALLEPHRKRSIRAFLRAPEPAPVPLVAARLNAFWDVVYHDTPAASHAAAVLVERELAGSERTVGDVLDGWRPAALQREG